MDVIERWAVRDDLRPRILPEREALQEGVAKLKAHPEAPSRILAHVRSNLDSFPKQLKPSELYEAYEAVLDLLLDMPTADWLVKHRGYEVAA